MKEIIFNCLLRMSRRFQGVFSNIWTKCGGHTKIPIPSVASLRRTSRHRFGASTEFVREKGVVRLDPSLVIINLKLT
jgi:hypothetical protein